MAASAYTFLYAQQTGCITTLNIPVVFEKIRPESTTSQPAPDTSTCKTRVAGCGIRDDGSNRRLRALDERVTVTGFRVTIVKNSGDVIEISNKTDYLNVVASMHVQGARKGDIIIFECIQARSYTGKTYTLKPLTITL